MRRWVLRFVWVALLVVAAMVFPGSAESLREVARWWPQTASTQSGPMAPVDPIAVAPITIPPIDRRSVTLTRDSRRVVNAAIAVLAEMGTPVIYLDRDRGLIRTGSVNVDQPKLRESTTPRFRPVVDRMGQRGGRYILNITATPISPNETLVRVDSVIILKIAGSNSGVGGQVLPSSMRIETELLQKLAAKVR